MDDLLALRFHIRSLNCDELPSTRQNVDACLLSIRTRDGFVHDQDGLVSKFSDFYDDRRIPVNDVCRTKGLKIVGMFEGRGGNDRIETRVFGKLND